MYTVRYPLKELVEVPVPPLRRNTIGDSDYDAVDARMMEWQVGMITPPTGIVIMVITLSLLLLRSGRLKARSLALNISN